MPLTRQQMLVGTAVLGAAVTGTVAVSLWRRSRARKMGKRTGAAKDTLVNGGPDHTETTPVPMECVEVEISYADAAGHGHPAFRRTLDEILLSPGEVCCGFSSGLDSAGSHYHRSVLTRDQWDRLKAGEALELPVGTSHLIVEGLAEPDDTAHIHAVTIRCVQMTTEVD